MTCTITAIQFCEQDAMNQERSYQPLRATVRRDTIFEDGFAALNALGIVILLEEIEYMCVLNVLSATGPKLKRRIQIIFESQLGYEEAGVDGGGVFKEFLTDLSMQAFDPNRGLFQHTSERLIYPNPHGYVGDVDVCCVVDTI